MKPISTLVALFLLASTATAVLQTNAREPGGSIHLRRNESSSDPGADDEDEPEIIQRCRAEELSPGSGLAIMIVLATGCAVHMPGSFLVNRRSAFYRLAPELGIFDTVALLLVVGTALLVYRKSFKESVTAALTFRYFASDNDRWWRREDCNPSSDNSSLAGARCLECAEVFFERIQRFGYERLLGDGLVLLALIKAFAVQGNINTNLLAASYALSFVVIELLSLAALHIGPERSRGEREAEALECAKLITLLDTSQGGWAHRSSPRWDVPSTPHTWPSWLMYAVVSLIGLAGALHLIFWPVSVPLFLFLEFTENHSSNGHWIFWYLTSAKWALYLAVVIGGLFLIVYLPFLALSAVSPETARPLSKSVGERAKEIGRDWEDLWMLDLYTALKVALIIRYYIVFFTGRGTTKPGWTEWLG